MIDEGAGVFRRGAGLVLGEYRHECLREGALAEDAAQEVRDAEGDVEGVGGDTGAGADEPGEHDVAHEAGNARDERHPAGYGRGLDQFARHVRRGPGKRLES